jgi:hypothetical protein
MAAGPIRQTIGFGHSGGEDGQTGRDLPARIDRPLRTSFANCARLPSAGVGSLSVSTMMSELAAPRGGKPAPIGRNAQRRAATAI